MIVGLCAVAAVLGGVLATSAGAMRPKGFPSAERSPAAAQDAHLLQRASYAEPARAGAGPTLVGVDTSQMKLTFEDRFDRLDLRRWDTVPIVNEVTGNGSSLPSNSERQWYVNDRYGPTRELKPWRIGANGLEIVADRTPPALRRHLGYDTAKVPELKGAFALGSYDFYSGRLATHRSFHQTYGYFEVVAKLPRGKGLWPAFWLLPLDMSWPPEIDVMEVLGHEPGVVYQTIHYTDTPNAKGEHKKQGMGNKGFDASQDFHRYGVHWTHETITFYLDGRKTASYRTPADMHRPMYMILNLAVGGSWPGDPDATTRFPAVMQVRSVRAWR